jgi:ferrous iron transport protein B
MSYEIALVGNPNCGKTTLFNLLTASSYKVANYPGVTVDKREGFLSSDLAKERLKHQIKIIDLPGTYSISGSSPDEEIVTRYLLGELSGATKPDLILAVVDATNLERNLYIISELIDTGFPLVVALNMMDLAEEREIKIYVELLSRIVDLTIVPIVSRSKRGISELITAIQENLANPKPSRHTFSWLRASNDSPLLTQARANPLRNAERRGVEALSDDELTAIATLRYAWIRQVVSRAVVKRDTQANKIDSLLTGKFSGLAILILTFFILFQAVYLWAQSPMEWISLAVDYLSATLRGFLPAGILNELITEGIIPGVGNVLVFVPQIAVLFLCIALLEDSGYLSRAAFLLDNFMRRFGLQGRAFIPLLSSFACAVPGIMATRTIPSRIDRLITIMIAPLMSCSARLPVYTLLIAVAVPSEYLIGFISVQGLVLLALYMLGIIGGCLVSTVLSRCVARDRESCFFVMEMPPLRLPVLRVALRSVYDNVLSFIRNATSIILACSVIIWFLASYPKVETEAHKGGDVRATYAGMIGGALEPLIKPLGFNWEIGFAIVASFPAREVFVTGLATVLNVQEGVDDTEHRGLIERLKERRGAGEFSTKTAVTLMVFYVFACQCVSTLAVCYRETRSLLWTLFMFFYMSILAYLAAWLTNWGLGVIFV